MAKKLIQPPKKESPETSPSIKCRFDKMVALSELKPHPNNPNQHPPGQLSIFANILKYQGTRRPIRVSKRSGYITAGHGQLEAYRMNGWAEAPVEFQDYDDDAQEFADLVADNTLASWAQMDLTVIEQLAKQFDGFNVDLLGIEGFTLQPETIAFPEQPGRNERTKSEAASEYLASQSRNIVLVYSLDEFTRIATRLSEIMTANRLESFSDTVKFLVDSYPSKNPEKKDARNKSKKKSRR